MFPVTADIDAEMPGSSDLLPFELLDCVQAPPVLWVGIVVVCAWELFLLAQMLILRGNIEKTILHVAYPEFRAIILYYR